MSSSQNLLTVPKSSGSSSTSTTPEMNRKNDAPTIPSGSGSTYGMDKDTFAMMNSPELQQIISEVVQQRDPLDDPNFDMNTYINKLFPNQQSLSGLDSAIQRVNFKITRLDDEILKTVREQSAESSKGTQNLESAQRAIHELAVKIKDIKFKAEKSEKIVKEICQDIKTLDYANHNLTNTISVLRRFHMYITAVDQLKIMAEKREYRDAASLLEAVNQLDTHFNNYVSNAKVKKIHDSFIALRISFDALVYDEFKPIDNFMDLTDSQQKKLMDVCYVVEALGKDTKEKFIKWFCGRELKEYNKFYQPGEESAKLENSERRYNWFQKAVKRYDENYRKIFPSHWSIVENFCEEFCNMTRSHLSVVLAGSKYTLSIETLVVAVKRTIAVENELVVRFGGSLAPAPPPPPPAPTPLTTGTSISPSDSTEDFMADVQDEPDELTNGNNNNTEMANPHSAAAIRARWKRHQQERQQQSISLAKEAASQEKSPNRFKGIISTVFDPYMPIYTQKEDGNIREMLSKTLREETWSSDDEKIKVLTSSTDLFYYYKTSMKVLMGLTKGSALFELFTLFKKYLKEYCIVLSNRIPAEGTKYSSADEQAVCMIINTAEYCGTTINGLVGSFKKNILPEFVEKIDLTTEQADFEGVVAKGLRGLVSNVIAKMSDGFNQMIRMPWSTWQYVEDQSTYVNQITEQLNSTFPIFFNWIANSTTYNYLCDSLVGAFVPVLISNMYKCKRFSEIGAQQMMLDVTSLKNILNDLPKGGKSDQTVPGRYQKFVKKEMARPENLLKIILAPQNSVVDTYKALATEGSEVDFATILELRGVPRGEQRSLLDAYKGTAPGVKKKGILDVFTGISLPTQNFGLNTNQ